jgi:hypothetical protein
MLGVSIHDLLWLMVVVGVGIAWCLDHLWLSLTLAESRPCHISSLCPKISGANVVVGSVWTGASSIEGMSLNQRRLTAL